MSGDDAMNKTELIALNERNLARLIGWVGVIDSKAKFILSVIIVVLGYSLTRVASLTSTCIGLLDKKAVSPAILLVLLLLGTLVCLLLSFVYLVSIIFPKRKPYTGKASYFYYESIAAMPAADFQTKMSSISEDETIVGLVDQSYNIAKVVKSKFDQLSTSIILFLVSVGLLILFSILHQTIPKLY